MSVYAELADGRRLEFPDGTDPAIIQSTVKKVIGVPASEPAPSEPGMLPQLGRQVGLTARHAIEGVGNYAGIFANPITAAFNLVSGQHAKLPTEALSSLLTTVGLPQAETPTERVVGDVSRTLAGAGAGMGLGNLGALSNIGRLPQMPMTAPQAVGDAMTSQPGLQAASAITGAGASGITREMGGGPGAQIGAGLAGALVPAAAQYAGEAAMRGIVRGGEAGRQQYANRLQTFENAGTVPTIGLASGNRAMQEAESGLGQVSVSSGVLDRAAGRIAQEMGDKVDEIASGIAPNANATRAGLAIDKGVKGFMDRFRATQGQLYDRLDGFIPPDTPVPVSNISAKLAEMTTPIPGAENVSARLQSPAISGIKNALEQDAVNGMVPYQAIKELRTTIGAKISNPSLTSDIPTAQWRQLYGALSEDMQAAAQQSGPQAVQALNRANAFTAAGHARIENVLDRIAGKDTVEKIFNAATSPSEMRLGGTTITSVMRSLEPEERDMVTAALVRRMGLSDPGQQNALGEQFSSQKFLTNWNKISPEAKMVLFAKGDLRGNLDQVAQAADYIRQGSKILANPSGTAPAISSQLTRWTIAGAMLTGHPGLAATVGGLLVGANYSAKLMTNPAFVRWLAMTTKMPIAEAPAAINILAQQSKKWPAEDRADLTEPIAEMGAAVGK